MSPILTHATFRGASLAGLTLKFVGGAVPVSINDSS